MGYRVVDHTADIGIEVSAADLGGLFAEAARGFSDVVTEVDDLEPSRRRELRLSAESLETLMVDWLSELLYVFETEELLLSEVDVEVWAADEGWRLAATGRGERFDGARHVLKVPVKAVTYHELSVGQDPGGEWSARVIFDI